MYVAALTEMLPWFFAFDHQHYARWLSVLVYDMVLLPTTHPSILEEFLVGGFVINKTGSPFSSIAVDHAHEQNNAIVKGNGGAMGLTELKRGMVAGPEIARMVQEFETCLDKNTTTNTTKMHQEQTPSVQQTFIQEVTALTQTIKEFGNPFC